MDVYSQRRKQKRRFLFFRIACTSVFCFAAAIPVLLAFGKQSAPEAVSPAKSIVVQTAPKHIVALDPGHGGYNPNVQGWDTGCEGNGHTEADLTYDLTTRLAEKLEDSGRFTVVLTTDGEAYLKGSQRGLAAQKQHAELLLSLHFDANSDSTVRGFTCYPATPTMETHSESLRFAKELTEQVSFLGEPLRGTNGIRYLYFVGENNQRVICESSDASLRSDPTYTILETCGCPALLCEVGFLTNPADAALIADETKRDALADAFYQAILHYFTEVA